MLWQTAAHHDIYQIKTTTYCTFQKHANSEVQKPTDVLCVSVFQGSLLVIVIMIDGSEKRSCGGGF